MTDRCSAYNSLLLRRLNHLCGRHTGGGVHSSPRGLKGWVVVLALVLSCANPTTGEAMRASQAEELEIKAAFVLNFLRLVNWDAVSGEGDASSLQICALGPSEFGTAVRLASNGKVIGNRTVTFRARADADPKQCRVLLVDSAQYDWARETLSALGGRPVLTIGNGAGFVPIGGMFELVVSEGKVQFDTNLPAVRASRLDVSARLLNLSRNLRKGAYAGGA